MDRQDARLYKRIGTHIRQVRVEQGLSQMQVAARAKIHHNYVSRLELGKAEVSVGVLVRIAKALKINIGDLWADASAHSS